MIGANAVEEGLFFTQEFFETIAPLICRHELPTYVIVNQATENSSLQNLEKWLTELFPGVPTGYSSIPEFTAEIYRAFEWIHDVVSKRSKK
jgi:hypothetical protein